jgi:hypothetical protein
MWRAEGDRNFLDNCSLIELDKIVREVEGNLHSSRHLYSSNLGFWLVTLISNLIVLCTT